MSQRSQKDKQQLEIYMDDNQTLFFKAIFLPTLIIKIQVLNFQKQYQFLEQQMFNNIPEQDFEPGQVVFVNDAKGQVKPARIVKKTSYGTYKVKLYGAKDEEYASEYNIVKYCEELADKILASTGRTNKKMIKYLKNAQKDNNEFDKKQTNFKPQKLVKQEQQLNQQGSLEQNAKKTTRSKYDAIQSIKVSALIEDLKNEKSTTLHYFIEGRYQSSQSNPKMLLMKKLEWALEDIPLQRCNINTQNIMSQIMESEVIEPVQYITSPIYNNLFLAIEYLKKTKNTKLKNYLMNRKTNVLLGFENHLNNCSVFIRAKNNFDNFIAGIEKINCKQMKQMPAEVRLNQSFPEMM